MRYAGLGMQIFVSLGLAVFIGVKLDKWLKLAIPVFAWVLPLIVLCAMVYKLIKDTSKQKHKNEN
ncbi:MAG TPA: AtpZ/AtpI family protein [Chitinophagaceae bacterium]|nr:AtpZ/AtpI family protein [Chitinophagaceae bacterium]